MQAMILELGRPAHSMDFRSRALSPYLLGGNKPDIHAQELQCKGYSGGSVVISTPDSFGSQPLDLDS